LATSYILRRSQHFPRPLAEVFEFFSRPENLQAITPPWLDFHITAGPSTLHVGAIIRYRLRLHGVPVRWVTQIAAWDAPRGFVDTQISGPYRLWRHEHQFTAEGGGTTMVDLVHYALPVGILGRIAHWAMVRRDVNLIFDYRRDKMRQKFG
jgi:hypothetical protein